MTIDDVKAYWNRRPCNIRHSPKPVGTKEYFDEVEARKYFVEPHIPEFAQFHRWDGKRVLEIGCGIGTDTVNFARSGAYVTAVDLSEESIKVAKQRIELYGYGDRVKFYCGNAEELSSFVPVENYDLVYSFGVIHHTPHPERVIEQVKKYLGSASEFKMMVYHRLSWKVFWIWLRHGGGVAWHSEAQEGNPVAYTYTRRSVRDLLKGMVVSRTRVEHIFPYSVPEYRNYEYKKVWYFRWMPVWMFGWLEKHFGWHLCVDASMV